MTPQSRNAQPTRRITPRNSRQSGRAAARSAAATSSALLPSTAFRLLSRAPHVTHLLPALEETRRHCLDCEHLTRLLELCRREAAQTKAAELHGALALLILQSPKPATPVSLSAQDVTLSSSPSPSPFSASTSSPGSHTASSFLSSAACHAFRSAFERSVSHLHSIFLQLSGDVRQRMRRIEQLLRIDIIQQHREQRSKQPRAIVVATVQSDGVSRVRGSSGRSQKRNRKAAAVLPAAEISTVPATLASKLRESARVSPRHPSPAASPPSATVPLASAVHPVWADMTRLLQSLHTTLQFVILNYALVWHLLAGSQDGRTLSNDDSYQQQLTQLNDPLNLVDEVTDVMEEMQALAHFSMLALSNPRLSPPNNILAPSPRAPHAHLDTMPDNQTSASPPAVAAISSISSIATPTPSPDSSPFILSSPSISSSPSASPSSSPPPVARCSICEAKAICCVILAECDHAFCLACLLTHPSFGIQCPSCPDARRTELQHARLSLESLLFDWGVSRWSELMPDSTDSLASSTSSLADMSAETLLQTLQRHAQEMRPDEILLPLHSAAAAADGPLTPSDSSVSRDHDLLHSSELRVAQAVGKSKSMAAQAHPKVALAPPPSATAANAIAFANGVSCHQCKISKSPEHLLFCTASPASAQLQSEAHGSGSNASASHATRRAGKARPKCHKKFCFTCLDRLYPHAKRDRLNWICPSCRGVCLCANCCRKQGRQTVMAGAREVITSIAKAGTRSSGASASASSVASSPEALSQEATHVAVIPAAGMTSIPPSLLSNMIFPTILQQSASTQPAPADMQQQQQQTFNAATPFDQTAAVTALAISSSADPPLSAVGVGAVPSQPAEAERSIQLSSGQQVAAAAPSHSTPSSSAELETTHIAPCAQVDIDGRRVQLALELEQARRARIMAQAQAQTQAALEALNEVEASMSLHDLNTVIPPQASNLLFASPALSFAPSSFVPPSTLPPLADTDAPLADSFIASPFASIPADTAVPQVDWASVQRILATNIHPSTATAEDVFAGYTASPTAELHADSHLRNFSRESNSPHRMLWSAGVGVSSHARHVSIESDIAAAGVGDDAKSRSRLHDSGDSQSVSDDAMSQAASRTGGEGTDGSQHPSQVAQADAGKLSGAPSHVELRPGFRPPYPAHLAIALPFHDLQPQ